MNLPKFSLARPLRPKILIIININKHIAIKIKERNDAEGRSNCSRKPIINNGAVSTSPAQITVSPVSPNERVNANIIPAMRPSFNSGKLIGTKNG